MDTNSTVHRKMLAALRDVAAEGLLLTGVAAVGLCLTVTASGRAGWGLCAGVAALAAFVLALVAFRAGRGRTAATENSPQPVLGDSAPRQTERGQLDTDAITLVLPDSASPVVFPVTTVTRNGVVEAVIVGEYGPSGGTAPEGSSLRSTVLGRWPHARVFERRSTGDWGADPRGYEAFYVELGADGTRSDIDDEYVFALVR